MKRKTRKKRNPGPLSALGWNRAFVNPRTGKNLSGAWVHPDTQAVRRGASQVSKKVFRDTPAGAKAAAKAGLI